MDIAIPHAETHAREGSVLRDGTEICYGVYGGREAGDSQLRSGAPAVVLLSGAGADRRIWQYQIPHLAKYRRVIAIDHRGSGRSGFCGRRCSADTLSQDVVAVLDAEDLPVADVLGFSLGGLVAQRLAYTHRNRVQRLVLMNCSLGAGNPDTVLPQQSVINMFLYSAALTDEDACQNAMDFNFGPTFRRDNPQLYEVYARYILENSQSIQSLMPVLVSSQPLVADYETLDMPILCILAKDDPIAPIANAGAFEKHLKRSRLMLLTGAHASMLLHPETVTEALLQFLLEEGSVGKLQ